MIRSVLLSLGGACMFAAFPFNFHWFVGGNEWAGWASSGCATAGIFFFVLGNTLP